MGRLWEPKSENHMPADNQIALDELEDGLFEMDADALTIPELHGFLSAVIVGPEVIKPSEWLPHIFKFEGKMPEFSSMERRIRYLGRYLIFTTGLSVTWIQVSINRSLEQTGESTKKCRILFPGA